MARYMRGYGQYKLGDPIVGPGISWHGPGTYLVYPRPAQFTRQARYLLSPPAVVGGGIAWHGPGTVYAKEPLRSIRGRKTSSLLKPPIIPPVAVQIFFGPKVYLNVMLPERSRSTVTRRRPGYSLGPPIVVGAGIAWHGPGTVYAKEPLRSIRRRKSEYLLRPPTVLTTAQIFFSAAPHLTRQHRTHTQAILRPPTDTVGLEDQGQISTWLTYSRRGKPLNGLGRTPQAQVYALGGIMVSLAPQRRGQAKSRLPQILVAAAAQIYYGPSVHLTRIRPRRTLWALRPPAILQTNVPLQITLAYSRRGVARYDLRPPTDTIGLEDQGRVAVHLAYSRRGQAKSKLRPPTDTIGLEDQGQVSTWLTYSRRGVPRYVLRAPAVIFQPPAFLPPEQVQLAPQRRPVAQYKLRPPVVGGGIAWHGPGTVYAKEPLRSIRRRKTEYFLRPPILVAAQAYALSTHLTRPRRPVAKSRLEPPLPTADIIFYGLQANYARIRPVRTIHLLGPPTVTAVSVVYLYGPQVNLTYSRRGKPVYDLRPPVVVNTAVEIYGPVVWLTRIKPPPTMALLRPFSARAFEVSYGPQVTLRPSRLPIARSQLRPPAVVAPVVSYGPFQWLTYGRRGTPKPFLKPPTVVSSPPAYSQVLPPALAYSRRGRPIYKLRPPTRVFPVLFFGPQVTLRPQVRGIPKPFLREPQVVRLAVEIYGPVVELTYSRRPKTRSELLPPTVVEAFFARPRVTVLARIKHPPVQHVLRGAVVVRLAVEIYGPKAWLTYSRRPKTKSRLLPPVVVGQRPFRGIKTWLTYSRRGRPTAFRQPEKVGTPPFRGILTHLTRIKPPPVLSTLKPPSVVGAGIAFYGPLTVLVRIRPPKVIHFLRLTLVAFRRPHGDVCGFDIAATFVCSLETPGSQVSGSSSSRFGISGSSRAATRIAGSESPGGSVSGSDRKAT